jgi:hypothetical protein
MDPLMEGVVEPDVAGDIDEVELLALHPAVTNATAAAAAASLIGVIEVNMVELLANCR